jgi:glycosyltransferase involved in cell wall biosynthesis
MCRPLRLSLPESHSMRIKIGAAQRDYAAMRNILGTPVRDVEHVRTSNIFRYPNYMLFKGLGRIDPLLGNLHWGRRDCDLLHFFNMVSISKTPWVTTFETALPRWEQTRPAAAGFGLKLLAGKSCKRLIALSECARDFQFALLDEEHPDFAEAIRPKVTVLHPPQAALADAPKPPPAPGEAIRFTLVGADFFRKGGREVLRVFDRMLAAGAPLHLTIVSTMDYGDYASHATREDLTEALALIAKWPERIVHHARLPNDQVLALFARTDVALLPTWADTYGYSVLEAQAGACPVLSTDIRALPEINDDRCGWVIPVPKDARGNGVLGTREERAHFAELLEAGIERAVERILADPAAIAARGAAALTRIREQHSPEAHGLRLREIYEEALAEI